MAILRYILPALPALMLTGCYADFEPETDTKPVLCINSLITPGEPIKIDVTRTWLFTDGESCKDHQVSDAVVTVMANDHVVGSDYLPAEGDKISIVADSRAYGTASAEVVVPKSVPVGNVKISPEVVDLWVDRTSLPHGILTGSMTFKLKVEIDVNDPADDENYYQFDYNWFSPSSEDHDNEIYASPEDDDDVHYYASGNSSLSIGGLDYHSEPIFKEHISLFESIMGNGLYSDFFLFSDRQINGKTYPLHLNFENCYFSFNTYTDDVSVFDCGMNIYLFNVSKSFYNWSLYKWNEHSGILVDLADIGLAESKWGYSNVSTCAGVVAAKSCSECQIDFSDFLKQALSEYLR